MKDEDMGMQEYFESSAHRPASMPPPLSERLWRRVEALNASRTAIYSMRSRDARRLSHFGLIRRRCFFILSAASCEHLMRLMTRG